MLRYNAHTTPLCLGTLFSISKVSSEELWHYVYLYHVMTTVSRQCHACRSLYRRKEVVFGREAIKSLPHPKIIQRLATQFLHSAQQSTSYRALKFDKKITKMQNASACHVQIVVQVLRIYDEVDYFHQPSTISRLSI